MQCSYHGELKYRLTQLSKPFYFSPMRTTGQEYQVAVDSSADPVGVIASMSKKQVRRRNMSGVENVRRQMKSMVRSKGQKLK